jgi:TolB-like protein
VRKLFSEIRRRRVVGTSALYLAGAWFLLQVFDTVFPILELPDWAMQAAFYTLLAGFPVAVGVSWVFDINFRRTEERTVEPPAPRDGDEAAPDIVSVVPTAPAPPGSIAVLPFMNIGANPDFEYFSDGLTEELLHLLATVPQIKVAARTSCFSFKNRNVDIRTIGAQLGVRTVLEGSVRWAGNRIRVTAQLIEVKSGLHLMSKTMDELLEDVFALQGEIANAIVEVLKTRLGKGNDARFAGGAQPTESIEAYQCYLRGRHRWQRRGAEEIRAAVALFNEALQIDPHFARAKSALAAAHAVTHEYTGESRESAFELARELAHQSIGIDHDLAEPRAVLGYLHLRQWQWAKSEHRLIEAIALDPNDPLFHQWYANLLNDLGRQRDALAEACKAYELDRVSPMANNVLAVCYTLQGRDEEALRHTRIAREFGVGGIVPAYVDYLASLRTGAWEDAASGWRAAMEAAGFSTGWVGRVVDAIADPARVDAAVAALTEAERVGALSPNIAFLQYVLLGAGDAAYALADELLADQRLNHAWLMLPEAGALREDGRFARLTDRMGLAQYWAEHGDPVLENRPLISQEPAAAEDAAG